MEFDINHQSFQQCKSKGTEGVPHVFLEMAQFLANNVWDESSKYVNITLETHNRNMVIQKMLMHQQLFTK